MISFRGLRGGTWTGAAAFAALALVPLAASAQDLATTQDVPQSADGLADVPNPSFWEGGGVRIGQDTILHPGVSVTGSYQSNVFFQDSKDGPAGPISSPLLRFGVGASWATITPGRMEIEAPSGTDTSLQKITFNLDASLEWDQYLSSDSAVTDQNDLGISFLGDVKFNPQGALTLDLRDGFVRNVTPGQSLRENADRDRNELDATAHFKPGGGALDFYLGYQFIVDVFEASILDYENRTSHQGTLGVRWQWLPHTALGLEGDLATVNPSNEELKSKSTPLRVSATLSTLLTPVFGAIVSAGYGKGFYASGEDVSTWLAGAELRYAVGPTLRTAVGYSHDFADALIGNFYIDHTLYARASAQLGARWQIRAKGEVRFRDYGGIHDAPSIMLIFCGDASCGKFRNDVLPRVELGTDYALLPWLLIGASYIFQDDSTDFFVQSSVNPAAKDSGAFTWHELDIRLQARW